ncbi:MAG: N-acetylmuramoyl-L-alanine amidase [Lachnospirales bacterium]
MKEISFSRNKALFLLYICVIIIGSVRVFYTETMDVTSMPVNHKNIVIDAGHGGMDPGKVAGDGTEEKGINLNISLKLEGFLEQGGAIVTTTRIIDEAVGKNKREDLKNRVAISKANNGDMFISIHQNSYPQSNVTGAQVFYNKNSEDSKRLALFIQKRLKEVVDNENNRVAKANSNYYVLKEMSVPAVIVECGFLSNSVEKEKLSSPEYQEKIAWAIYMGILDFYGESVA